VVAEKANKTIGGNPNEQQKHIPQLRRYERGNLIGQRIRYGGNHSVCGNAVSHKLYGNADAKDVHRFV